MIESSFRGCRFGGCGLCGCRFCGGGKPSALAEDGGSFFLGEGEDGFCPLRQFFVDEGVGEAQFVLDLARTERAPALKGDPMGFGKVGRGDDAVALDQLMKTLGAAMEPKHAGSGSVDVGHGEHLAAEVAIAGPVDEMMAPVQRFSDMGKGEADLADALVIHDRQVYASARECEGNELCRLQQAEEKIKLPMHRTLTAGRTEQKGVTEMKSLCRFSRAAALVLSGFAGLGGAGFAAGQADFASTVTNSHPVAYFRMDATSGKSQSGAASYTSQGGVSVAEGSLPTGIASYAQLDGKSGWIVTTQKGGVTTAASIMAWVNLADLPSKAGRTFYVAGESQSGNDLDVQIETDNVLRFFTGAGGRVEFAPPQATLLNQWHMIVATLDTASKARAIYWDGKPAAHDAGGGNSNKTAAFSVGASTVWGNRWLKGGVAEAALWNRALKPAEVAAMWSAANGAASTAGAQESAGGGGSAGGGTGPFATTAKVEAEDANGEIRLKREEQIAMMFLVAIEQIEHDCQMNLKHACSMAEAMSGAGGEHLKFDPNKTDPNYNYTLTSGGMAWEAHANAKKPGFTGFCFMSRSIGTTVTTYSASGKSGWVDTEIMGRGIEGDSFDTR